MIEVDRQTALLRSVAEQLKMPLTAIARQAELGQLTSDMGDVDLQCMQVQAQAAPTLVDSYLLGLQLLRGQQVLTLEPVPISSLLVEVAHELTAYAKQYDIHLDVRIAGKYQPVMGHRAALKAALLSLSYALFEGIGALQPQQLVLAVHRTPRGIVTGMYGDMVGLNAESWRRALRSHGTAVQPIKALSGSAAGLFVANTILEAMDTRLRSGRHLHMHGIATTLLPSQQLRLV